MFGMGGGGVGLRSLKVGNPWSSAAIFNHSDVAQ
jgi:hypothetical protein